MAGRCHGSLVLGSGVSKSPHRELRPQVSKRILGKYHELYMG